MCRSGLPADRAATANPDGAMTETWLILETSGRAGTVALARGEAVVRSMPLDAARRHARDLAPTMTRVLKEEGLRPTDLTGVMVCTGPGSYTGLRVGVMSAKTLAYAVGCKLVAVPAFPAVAEQAPAEAGRLWVIGDALQGQVYVQEFARNPADRTWAAACELHIDGFDAWSAAAADGDVGERPGRGPGRRCPRAGGAGRRRGRPRAAGGERPAGGPADAAGHARGAAVAGAAVPAGQFGGGEGEKGGGGGIGLRGRATRARLFGSGIPTRQQSGLDDRVR